MKTALKYLLMLTALIAIGAYIYYLVILLSPDSSLFIPGR